ncbi:MAG: DUF2911 domain-containing protein [Cyclobacteriaceae bacterium]
MRIFLLATGCLFFCTTIASAQNFRGLDKSPLDIAYYPDNFAHDRKSGDEAVLKVIYSRPQLKGREMFGEKVPYGKVWRTGANEATEIKVYQDITIGEKTLPAGQYAVFTIPNEDEWTVIFNSALDYWGAYSYDESQDVLRATASVSSLDEPAEAFTIQFDEAGGGNVVMRMAWDRTVAELPIMMNND